MALTGSQKAYLQARAGIGRAGAIRSNYVFPLFAVITVDGVNITGSVRYGTLHITQQLNEQPDTAAFEVLLTSRPVQEAIHVGADVLIGLNSATDNALFGGRILTTQTTRGPAHTPSVVSVMCADYLQVLDSEYLITYDWPAQPANATIGDLLNRFANKPGAVGITTTFVQQSLPSHAAVGVINERFSTVLRRLVTMFPTGGGFYVDPYKDLHLWSGISEPNVADPQTLTLDVPSLKAFAETHEASQQRNAVIVEGARTTAPIGIPTPTIPPGFSPALEVPIESVPVIDASIFDRITDTGSDREVRIGTQRLVFRYAEGMWTSPVGTPQTTETTADVLFDPAAPGPVTIPVASLALLTGRIAGWIRIDEQYLRVITTTAGPALVVPRTGYGALVGPVNLGATVTVVDSLGSLRCTQRYQSVDPLKTMERLRGQPIESDVVMTVRSATGTGIAEHLVQDGRYSRTGATARGTQELADFAQPFASIDFETDDPNAKPGRLQAYSFDVGHPVLAPSSGQFMILSADITWPVWGQAPRIQCRAARVLAANVMDTWVTDTR